MIKAFVVVFFLLMVLHVSGQESVVSGYLTIDSLKGSAIHVFNKTKNRGVVSNDEGFFELKAVVKDTILFTSIEIKDVELVVEAAMLTKELHLKLEPEVNQLEEVVVKKFNLTGNLLDDLKLAEEETTFVAPNFGGIPNINKKPPTPMQRKISEASTGSLNLIINMISGRLKKLKEQRKIEEIQILLDEVNEVLDITFFIEDLGLTKDQIGDFQSFCIESPEFKEMAQKEEKLSLIEFFFDKAKAYKALLAKN